ncbi:MAG TPA: hypothetical protein VNY05_23880 [Candidatus Acidoferrales bacterium]|jgi:hypothetical protein|nr:hypothetical protein [Candidatus Acidoferrales bacterium]
MIEQVRVGFEDLIARKWLFSPRLEDDPWVLYHATSSPVERKIDQEGFAGSAFLVTREHVIHMVSLYRSMNWAGIHSDGYAALGGITLGRAHFLEPHCWFREASMRSLVYAQRSWAGGEWAMSFRQAFDDLVEFLRSETARQEHLQSQVQLCRFLVMSGAAPSPVIKVDAARLTAALEPLQVNAEACSQLVQRYEHGLIYAVKFVESDVPNLSDRGGSGILYTGTVLSDRIVGKACLDLGDRPAPRKSDDVERMIFWREGPLALRIRANGTKARE